jgi:hypothetical protein
MTRRERLERRAERRETWADSARAKADARFDSARHALDGIEPGQPILAGHHSERHHRRALDRHDVNMRAATERQQMAERHEQAAATLRARLDSSIYSDDENAAEALQGRIREREAQVERVKALNAAIQREMKDGLPAGWLDRVGASEQERLAIQNNATYNHDHAPTFAAYILTNLRGRITADRKRLESIQARQKRAAEAEAAGGVTIKRTALAGTTACCVVTFAEKPERTVLDALKAAGYCWSRGSWIGDAESLPAVVAAMVEAPPGIVCGAPESSHDPGCMVAHDDEPRADADETP